MLYVDGSSNAEGRGAGLVITGPDNFLAEYALRLDFKASNNEAKYEALIVGIALAAELLVVRIRAHSDSQLVVSQVNGFSEAKEERMIKYLKKVGNEISTFKEFQIVQIPRTLNTRADALSKMASSGRFEPGNIYTEILPQPSIEKEEILQINEEPSWMHPIVQYLKDGVTPSDRKEARRLVAKAAHYILDGQGLYKRSFSWPLLKCLRHSAVELAMREVHEGICGDHSGGKVLAHKILRRGFFWPTLQQDTSDFVRKCEQCQKFATVPRLLAVPYKLISNPIPFAMWGMDLLGPFPNSIKGHRMMYVAIDYFTKWVEAKAVKKITSGETKNFFYHDIICRFGIPRTLVTDNGSQFASRRFKDFCGKLGIDQRFTSVSHP
ncbi:uncharacterized protein LOC143853887 [Tasmannia lanceolata]|uniref:uncharacterized protein LOC143853887 n=1 Tax=Tasmannia lanceolata TaxID=3420 RepID=UPI00406370B4